MKQRKQVEFWKFSLLGIQVSQSLLLSGQRLTCVPSPLARAKTGNFNRRRGDKAVDVPAGKREHLLHKYPLAKGRGKATHPVQVRLLSVR
jgi:hypothetical protein